MNELQYLIKCYPLAVKAGERFGLNPLVILAQGAHESAWGTSMSARQRKNYFGITASGSINEFWNGSFSVANNQYSLKFRIYKTEQDSFMDFARLIKSNYKNAYSVSNDYQAYAKAIAYSPYISESNGDNREVYRNAVIKLYEKIGDILLKNPSIKKKR